jgi:hypothetical protein
MAVLGKKYLLTQVSYLLAPIVYHSSAEGNTAYYCFLITEFVDSYALFILALLFIVALALIKNLLLKILGFFKVSGTFNKMRNSLPRPLKSVANVFKQVKAFFNRKQ